MKTSEKRFNEAMVEIRRIERDFIRYAIDTIEGRKCPFTRADLRDALVVYRAYKAFVDAYAEDE